MSLAVLWFGLIGVLFAGYCFLEGFDFGIGMLAAMAGRNRSAGKALLDSIAPHWDGNEVWLITAGGAMFAAFPGWYATFFSGYYLPLFLLLMGLVLRGVAIEFRHYTAGPEWQRRWNWLLAFGSGVVPLLLGTALSSLLQGVPIDRQLLYRGSLFDLLSGYSVLNGLNLLLLCFWHGSLFAVMKLGQEALPDLIRGNLRWIGIAAAGLWTLSWLVGSLSIPALNVLPAVVPAALGLLALLMSGRASSRRKDKRAFLWSGAAAALYPGVIFSALFPRVMVSSWGEAFNLTIYNTAASAYSLRVLSIVALTLVPLVLLYQAWSYWIFRKRVAVSGALPTDNA